MREIGSSVSECPFSPRSVAAVGERFVMGVADRTREFEALRRERDAWRAERARRGSSRNANAGAAGPEARLDDWEADYRALAEALREFAEDAGRGVADHPLAGVAAALIAGFLIGRLLGR
jgi:hypothetical protein